MIRPVLSVYDWASRTCSDISWWTTSVSLSDEATALEAQSCRDHCDWEHASSCRFMSVGARPRIVFPDPHHTHETLRFDQKQTL